MWYLLNFEVFAFAILITALDPENWELFRPKRLGEVWRAVKIKMGELV